MLRFTSARVVALAAGGWRGWHAFILMSFRFVGACVCRRLGVSRSAFRICIRMKERGRLIRVVVEGAFHKGENIYV